jgi:hypothetical protein
MENQWFGVQTCSERVQKGSGIAQTLNRTNSPVQVSTQTQTLTMGSVQLGSGSNHSSEPNLPITIPGNSALLNWLTSS